MLKAQKLIISGLYGLFSILKNTVRLKWIPLEIDINKLQKRADLFYHFLLWTFLYSRSKFRFDYFHSKQNLQLVSGSCLLRCTKPQKLIYWEHRIANDIPYEIITEMEGKEWALKQRILSNFVTCTVSCVLFRCNRCWITSSVLQHQLFRFPQQNIGKFTANFCARSIFCFLAFKVPHCNLTMLNQQRMDTQANQAFS